MKFVQAEGVALLSREPRPPATPSATQTPNSNSTDRSNIRVATAYGIMFIQMWAILSCKHVQTFPRTCSYHFRHLKQEDEPSEGPMSTLRQTSKLKALVITNTVSVSGSKGSKKKHSFVDTKNSCSVKCSVLGLKIMLEQQIDNIRFKMFAQPNRKVNMACPNCLRRQAA